jgi:hypothetical protein
VSPLDVCHNIPLVFSYVPLAVSLLTPSWIGSRLAKKVICGEMTTLDGTIWQAGEFESTTTTDVSSFFFLLLYLQPLQQIIH